MGVESELKGEEVRIAGLEAEATTVQQTKQAEGEAQVHVLQAKGEADAMQYTLPLKAKQIQQSRLEAQACQQSTIQNAEAEADRIRVTAVADADRLKSEAAILKDNPLLTNKIVAVRLSEKLQIMMVPADGKFFFANDVLRSMRGANPSGQAEQPR
jgi:hypothetical protein